MNTFITKTAAVLSLAFLTSGMWAMQSAQETPPQGFIEKKITKIQIQEPSMWEGNVPQRIFILPYRSTGMAASIMRNTQETPGVIINGIEQFIHGKNLDEKVLIDLQNPITINVASRNPELLVIVEGNEKELARRVFKDDDFNGDDIAKNNTLIPNFPN